MNRQVPNHAVLGEWPGDHFQVYVPVLDCEGIKLKITMGDPRKKKPETT
jgi:hypothetical protein